MPFRPRPGDSIEIDGITFTFTANPQIPRFAYSQEGRVARVYRIDGAQRSCALKVFKPMHQSEATAALAERLAPFASLPGMRVCQRSAVVPERHGRLIRKHADLKYAILMPWVHGPTWHDVLTNRRSLDRQQSMTLARSLSEVLVGLEQRGVAHCDLSAPNVLLPMLDASSGATTMVELVDVEQLYSPDLPETDRSMAGSPGYAHATAASGIWEMAGDRFAGAILLSEMLAWSSPRVRDAAAGDSFFEPGELQRDCPRYRVLRGTLADEYGEAVAVLLDRAWQSRSLRECPGAGDWANAVEGAVSGSFGRPAARPAAANGADAWGQYQPWQDGLQETVLPDPWGAPAAASSQSDPWGASTSPAGQNDPWSNSTSPASQNDPWGGSTTPSGQNDPWSAPANGSGQVDPWGASGTMPGQGDPWSAPASPASPGNSWTAPASPPGAIDPWTGSEPSTSAADPWANLAWTADSGGTHADAGPISGPQYGLDPRAAAAAARQSQATLRAATGTSRGAALAVDLVLSTLLCVAIGIAIAVPLKISYIVPGLLVWLAYYTVSWTTLSATPGQILFGLRVVDAHTSQPLTFWQSFVRCTAYVLSLASFGVGFLMGLRGPGAASLGDWLARTRVVATD